MNSLLLFSQFLTLISVKIQQKISDEWLSLEIGQLIGSLKFYIFFKSISRHSLAYEIRTRHLQVALSRFEISKRLLIASIIIQKEPLTCNFFFVVRVSLFHANRNIRNEHPRFKNADVKHKKEVFNFIYSAYLVSKFSTAFKNDYNEISIFILCFWYFNDGWISRIYGHLWFKIK